MSHLFTPVTLGPVTFDNRIVVSPMCQYSATDGIPNAWHLQHWGSMAASGVGLVMIESTAIEKAGAISHGCLGLYTDMQEDALAYSIQAIKAFSPSKFGIQLGHSGRKGSTSLPWSGGTPLAADDGAWTALAPSATPFMEGWPAPQALNAATLDKLVDNYVAAAGRAHRAGIDVAEFHAAHGYLIHQFLSPLANTRDDEYGGSLENRMRFPLRVAKALRAAWPLVLGARITATDWADGGITPDEAVAFAKELKTIGFDYVCVTSGGVSPLSKPQASPGYHAPFARRIRQEAGIATRAVGLISTPQQADALIANGDADQVAIGRGFLDDPRWTWHAAEALGEVMTYPHPYQRATPANWPGAVRTPAK